MPLSLKSGLAHPSKPKSELGEMPMGRLECIGYEVGILLRFGWMALMAQIFYALMTSTGLIPISNAVVFVIYLAASILTIVYDYHTLSDRNPPSPTAQMIRSALNMAIFVLFSEFLATSDPVSTQEALEIARNSVNSLGSVLSLNVFLFGLLFANIAFLACFRAIVNTIIYIGMGYTGFCRYMYGSGRRSQSNPGEPAAVAESDPPSTTSDRPPTTSDRPPEGTATEATLTSTTASAVNAVDD